MVSRNLDEGCPTRVILIDDGSIFLRPVLAFLRQTPEVQVVATVGGLEEAMAQVRPLQAEIVISDLASAGLPGLTTIGRLHADFPQVGVIVLSSLDLAPYRQAALEAGATEFVSRVSAGVDLLPAIRRVAVVIRESKGSPAPGPAVTKEKATGKSIESAPNHND